VGSRMASPAGIETCWVLREGLLGTASVMAGLPLMFEWVIGGDADEAFGGDSGFIDG